MAVVCLGLGLQGSWPVSLCWPLAESSVAGPRARLVFQTPPSLSLSNPTGTLGLTQNSDLQRNDPCNGSQHKSGEPFSQQRAGHIWRAPVKAEPCLVMMAASGYFGDHDFFSSGALEILKTAKLSSCSGASSGHSCLCGGLSYLTYSG